MSFHFTGGNRSIDSRPIGAPSHVSASTQAPHISSGEVIPAGLASKHGQPGRYVARPNPHDNYSSVIHDLRDFREGMAITTNQVVEGLIVEAPEYMTRKIYPLQRTDRMILESSVWEFNHGALPQVPEQGTYRVLSSRRRKRRGRMVRRGIGLDTETTSLLTAGGQEQQQRMLAGLAIVVLESAIMDVAWEITEEGEKHLSNASAYAGRSGAVTNPLQQARAERDIAFSVHKNPQRFVTLVNQFMRELSAVRSVSGPYALIVPADFRLNIDRSNRMLGKMEGYDMGAEMFRSTFSGDGPVLTFENGVEVYQLPELHVYDRPTSGDVRAELFQMLSRTRIFAEYYQMVMGPRRKQDLFDGVTNANRADRFKTSQRDIVLYDVQKDTYVRVSFIEALKLALASATPNMGGNFSESDHKPGTGARGAPFYYYWDGQSRPAEYVGDLDENVLKVSDIRQIAQSKLGNLTSGLPGFEQELGRAVENYRALVNDDATQNKDQRLARQHMDTLISELRAAGLVGNLDDEEVLEILTNPSFEAEEINEEEEEEDETPPTGASFRGGSAPPSVTYPLGPDDSSEADLQKVAASLAPKNAWSASPVGMHVIHEGNVSLVTSNDVAAAYRLGPQPMVMANLTPVLAQGVANVARVAYGAGAEGADAMNAWANNVAHVASDVPTKQQFACSLIEGTKIADIGDDFTPDQSAAVVAEVKRQATISAAKEVKKVTTSYKNDKRIGEPLIKSPEVKKEFDEARKFLNKRGALNSDSVADIAMGIERIRAAAKVASAKLPANRVAYVVLPGTMAKDGNTIIELSANDMDSGIDLMANNPSAAASIGAHLDAMQSAMTRARASTNDRARVIEEMAKPAAGRGSSGFTKVPLEKAREVLRRGGKVIDPNTGKLFVGRPEDLRFAKDMEGYIGERLTFNAFMNITRKKAAAKGTAKIGINYNEVTGDVARSEGSNMRKHFDTINRFERNPLLRTVMVFSLMDKVFENGTLQPLIERAEQNEHIPVNVLLFAPFMTYVMDTFSLLKYGSETGNFYYGFPAMMQGNDVSNQTTMTTFSIWMKAFTHDGKNIINIPYMRCRQVVNGCGTEMFDRARFIQEVRAPGDAYTRKSLIAVACGITENEFPEFISPAGTFGFSDDLADSVGKYHFSSAKAEELSPTGWKMMSRYYKPQVFTPDSPFGANPVVPQVAMQGQVVYHNGNGFRGVIVNNAHRGSNSSYRGAAKVLNGPDTYFMQDEEVVKKVIGDVVSMWAD